MNHSPAPSGEDLLAPGARMRGLLTARLEPLRNAVLGLVGIVGLALASGLAAAAPPGPPALANGPATVAAGAANAFRSTLTEEERGWLREHPVIRVAQDPSWPPIEFATADGTPSGMTADYLALLEERLGLKFERVLNLSWQEAYARMKRGEIDLTTTVAVTSERETFWAFTKPYMTMPIVIVTRQDVAYVADLRELEGRKVVVVDGYVADIWIARDFPKIELVRVKSTKEALALLERGEVFACVENMLVVGHYLAELKISELKISGSSPYTNAQCMAVRKDWAPLAGILDKALDSISPPERHAIYRRWLPVHYEHGFDFTRLLPLAALVAFCLLGLAAWKWKQATDRLSPVPGGGRLKPWKADLFALSATAATFGLRIALDGPLGGQPTLVIFTLPIMLSAYLGGLRAGLLATAVSYFGAGYYLLTPIHSFAVVSGVEGWQQIFVALAGVFISGLSEALHRARRRAEIATREQRQAVAALRQSEARMAGIVESAMDAVITVDDGQRVLVFNTAAEKMFLCPAAEAIGGTIERFIPMRFHAGHSRHFERFGEDGVTSRAIGKLGAISGVRSNGEEFPIEASISKNTLAGRELYTVILRDITERKLAEEALRESAERFRVVFEQAPIGICEVTLDYCFLRVNERFCEIVGSTQEALLKDSRCVTTTHPDDRPSDAAAVQRLLDGEEKVTLEKRYLHSAGHAVWVQLTLSLLRSPEGRPMQFIGIVEDITKRRQAEEALRASEESFRTMANSIPQLAWMAHADGFIFRYNERWFEYTGTTPEQMEGWGWQSVHDPQALPRVMAEWTGAIATGQSFEMTFPLRGADGKFRRFLTRAVPLKDGEGKVVQWFGTNTDVDELKRAEANLERSNRALRTVSGCNRALGQATSETELLQEVCQLIIHDGGYRLAWVGLAEDDAEKSIRIVGLAGYDEGYTETAKITWADTERGRGPAGLVIRTGSPSICRHIATDPIFAPWREAALQRGYEALAVFPVRDNGRAFGAFAIYSAEADRFDAEEVKLLSELADDLAYGILTLRIRARHRVAEEEIRTLNTELEQRVRQRTAQLEAANQELEAFSYSVSHDLRTPLRSIDGFSRILLEDYAGKLDEEGQDSLRRVRAASQRMGELIDDMLKLSRVTRNEMQPGTVDLSALAHNIAAELEQEEPARRVEWVIAEGLAVQGDAALLRVAMQNLLGNAWKFTSKQPQARIEVGATERDGVPTHFVRDNGAGFDMAFAGKLFGAFQRLHDAAEFPGTGIGLATVQRVLHRHGGRIWAESAVGQGATFFFTLPEHSPKTTQP